MVTYKLVSKNEFDKKMVVLQNHKLSELDNFIYNNFKNKIELSKYFKINNSNFYITYNYQNNPKILDLILKDDSREFSSLLHNVRNNCIDINSTDFRNLMDDFINNASLSEIKFLYNNKYIDKYTYSNLMEMKNCDKDGFDYVRDMAELFSYIKQNLKRYICFRRLYSGMIAYHYYGVKVNNDNNPKIARTENEFVNSAFNHGGYDELYSYFDLDDLYKIDGIDDLEIEGCKKK